RLRNVVRSRCSAPRHNHSLAGRREPHRIVFGLDRHIARSQCEPPCQAAAPAPRAATRPPRREQRDELATFHSITSSAMASRSSRIWRPSILAVLRLMLTANLVGCSIVNSPGFTPSESYRHALPPAEGGRE